MIKFYAAMIPILWNMLDLVIKDVEIYGNMRWIWPNKNTKGNSVKPPVM